MADLHAKRYIKLNTLCIEWILPPVIERQVPQRGHEPKTTKSMFVDGAT